MTTEYLDNHKFEADILKFQSIKREKSKYELLIEDIQDARLRHITCNHFEEPPKWKIIQKEHVLIVNEYRSYQNELTSGFYLLSENIARYAKFNLVDMDDAIQEGVMICFEKVDRFDPTYRGKNGQKSKAFNYMTTCIYNHLKQLYRTASNYNELKRRYHEFIQNKFQFNIDRKSHGLNAFQSSEHPEY